MARLQAQHPLLKIDCCYNPYVGCAGGCVYCPSSRLSKTGVRTNMLHLLSRELDATTHKLHIGIGTSCEPYCGAEKKFNLTRHALDIIMKRRMPLQIFTKSELVLRDISMLRDYSQSGLLAVSISICTMDKKLSQTLEPGTPDPQSRIDLLVALKRQGIFAGVVLSPIIPAITDSREQMKEVVERVKKAEGDYILPAILCMAPPAMKSFFMNFLHLHFPKVEHRLFALYERNIMPPEPYIRRINDLLAEINSAMAIPMHIPLEPGICSISPCIDIRHELPLNM